MTVPKSSSQEAEHSAAQSPVGSSITPTALFFKRWGPILFSVGLVLAGLIYGLWKYAPLPVASTTQDSSAERSFGLADYENLEPGVTTLMEARVILGKGVETSRSETEVNFVWLNPDESKITAVFSGGKLKSKAQEGLK